MHEMSWCPSATLSALKARSAALKKIRFFFEERGYLEVETPIMAAHGITDLHLENLVTQFRKTPYYLQTSPEYHMKRLLAAGAGSIYQLSRVFRDDEFGRWHNPEFTLLEWYKLGVDEQGLIDEVDALLQWILDTPPVIKKTYQEAFIEALGICPLTSTIQDMRALLDDLDLGEVFDSDEKDKDNFLYLLMSHHVEPYLKTLNAPVAVYDFPLSQASLAKPKGQVAARFEIYYEGVELCNGFYELQAANLQRERFIEDNQKRVKNGRPIKSIDDHLLSALEYGLPSCSGVALGVDRLIALLLKASSLQEVIAFPIDRA